MSSQQTLLGSGSRVYADPGQTILDTGSSWTVPDGVWSVSVVCIGGGGGGWSGGGGGAALAYGTNISVTPGSSVQYAVGNTGDYGGAGGDTWFSGTSVLKAGGGGGGGTGEGVGGAAGGAGGTASGSALTAGYAGGDGGNTPNGGLFGIGGGGGGGAGGYTGAGGNGGWTNSTGFEDG